MTVLFTLLTPIPGEAGYVFAIVADDRSARYVFNGGSDSDELGLDSKRIKRLAENADQKPRTAAEWTAVAAQQVGNPVIADSLEFEDIEDAVEAAVKIIARTASSQPNPNRAPGQRPDGEPEPAPTRADRMDFERAAMDEWMRLYPEAADDDVHDPEAELALRHLMTPPTDPEKPHKWLPISTAETDCGFCELPEDDALHTARADTITRGAN